jgi:hypothetical protein
MWVCLRGMDWFVDKLKWIFFSAVDEALFYLLHKGETFLVFRKFEGKIRSYIMNHLGQLLGDILKVFVTN